MYFSELDFEEFDDCLFKPLNIEKLEKILDKWIPDEKKEPAAAQASDNSEISFIIDGVDIEAGIKLLGSAADYLRVLRIFNRNAEAKLTTLQNSLNDEDFATFGMVVHGLRGALAHIGADGLAARAKALEVAVNAQDFDFIHENAAQFIQDFKTLAADIAEKL